MISLVIILAALVQFSYLSTLNNFGRAEPRLSNFPVIIPGTTNHTMSACLLLHDDNHFLVEWLAYHWQTMPLRRLVVATDPRSRTSPSNILERWRRYMNITEWKDDDYFPLWSRTAVIQSKRQESISDKLVELHRTRQRHFYVKCMRQLKREHDGLSHAGNLKPSWAAFIDVDEFLFPNWNWEYQFLLASRNNEVGRRDTIVAVLHQLANFQGFRGPCIGVPRLLIGAKVGDNGKSGLRLSNEEARQLDMALAAVFPSTENRSLLTWDWNWHQKLHSPSANKAGKALLDLSHVSTKMMDYSKTDVHRPNKELCTEDGMWKRNVESPLVLHHYIGTFEQFTFRSDPRQGRRTADEYSGYQDVSFGMVGPWESRRWLVDFVAAVGATDAAHLLEGAGQVERDATPALAEDEFFQRLQNVTLLSPKTRISWMSEKPLASQELKH
jgi:hypothetical protein